jgi:hypothetical protein
MVMRAPPEGNSDRAPGAKANQRLARGLNITLYTSEMAVNIRISGID